MDNLRFYMVTYNVATKQPEQDLHKLVGFEDLKSSETLPDFYVVGLQEVKSQPQNMVLDSIFDDPWTNAFREVLAKMDYVKVKTVRLQGTVLNLFCLRKHLIYLRDIETQYTRTGFRGLWGNKGAVTVRLSIYGCSICVVNCHLTPHDHLLQQRIADYDTIVRAQSFRAKETSSIFFHDYVFWIGDMNFRLLEGPSATEIDELVGRGELTRLLAKDQLRYVMAMGEAFGELEEPLPTFPPTYKFEFHTSLYDLRRRPSWTDRMLYKVNANVYENITLKVEQLLYRSIDSYTQSDHKPVVGEYIVKVFSDYYERVVEFQPIDTWIIDEENSVSYTLATDVRPTTWDWIGIFKEGFAGLEEYLCYVYVMRGLQGADAAGLSRTVVFPLTAVRAPGSYCLLYFSDHSASVLGMSRPFVATLPPAKAWSQFPRL
ncbi:inositol polyphosphate 5-phosphatase K-like isoform X2 [Bacillus rossius redtenbacheri]|uniref:inositol polyphosphate 5-phosphatase K-like isoform X2 n=1 Tax=Bacillus rossius redtenbacheri TaxID=93214 RepID=UPI002FDE2B74